MRPFILASLLLVGPLGALTQVNAQACPANSITTTSIGVGSGPAAPSILAVKFEPNDCRVEFEVQVQLCCNQTLTQFALLYGPDLLPAPFALPTPTFFAGSNVLVAPIDALGLFAAPKMKIALPTGASLIGVSIDFQALAVFTNTVSGATTFGMTQVVDLLFQ